MSSVENITIRRPFDRELRAVRDLRHVVLDADRIMPRNQSISGLDLDPLTILIAAFDGTKAVSTVRLSETLDPELYRVEKLATHPVYRRRKLAARVLAEAEHRAVVRDAALLIADVPDAATAFFKSQGFRRTGLPLMDNDGLLNTRMEKRV